ncbi:endonuclease/exonuclease/phosphatase family protein [Microbacteriaceae bacterium VKM Ac-2854]|nr:endonuclease/exonuclease/phosphatase family protein [Microbacteriaceae bacterium VKM Ac-2854]
MPRRPAPPRRPGAAVVLTAAVLLAALIAFRRLLPENDGWLSILETTMPWLGIVVVALLVAAVVVRSRAAGVAVTVLAVTWGVLVLPAAVPVAAVESGRFTVLSENLEAGNASAADIVADLAARDPDAIALQELSGDLRDEVAAQLEAAYPYDYQVGTVGIWSRTELSDGSHEDLGLGYDRALSVSVATPQGALRLYVVHLASFRVGEHEDRDAMLGALGARLAADESERIAVVGDFNAATDDHELAPVLREVRLVRGDGFGFPLTWPAAFPVVALDHAFTRGIPAATVSVLPANGSDHRGISLTIGSA